jgi:hypothetical protein
VSFLSENQAEVVRREIRIEQMEPIGSGEIERNAQYRVYQIAGNFYAVEVALPSGWFLSVEQIKESDIPKFVK